MIPLQLDQMTKFLADLLSSAQSLLDVTERSQGDFSSPKDHRMLPIAETIPAASPVSVKGEKVVDKDGCVHLSVLSRNGQQKLFSETRVACRSVPSVWPSPQQGLKKTTKIIFSSFCLSDGILCSQTNKSWNCTVYRDRQPAGRCPNDTGICTVLLAIRTTQ